MSASTMAVTMLLLGLVAGVLSGMFGIGGGLGVGPALIVGFGFGPKVATGTSLFALMWPVGLLGVLEYWRRGEMEVIPGALIAIGLFVGAYFGAKITGAISPATMKRCYGAFLLIVGVYFLYTASGPSAPKPASETSPRSLHPSPAGAESPDQVQRPPDLS